MNSPASISLILVTYRDSFQWQIKQKKGLGSEYQQCSTIVQMAESDLKALGISNGAKVKIKNTVDSVVVRAKLERKLSAGVGLMPVGPYANKLISYNPERSRLPNFKRIEVRVEPTDEELTLISE